MVTPTTTAGPGNDFLKIKVTATKISFLFETLITSIIWPNSFVITHLKRIQQSRNVDIADLTPKMNKKINLI